MIVSVFLRYYKVFRGIQHIPITIKEYFSVYFGYNGVGKSSILEALDSYFNDRTWNINKFVSIQYQPCVVPVFIIEKERLLNHKKKS